MDVQKKSEAFRNISEVASELDVPKHVLRFWEAKFTQLKPMKRGGGRRYYRPEDVDLLKGIRQLLYSDGYTIRGVQKLLKENGIDYVKKAFSLGGAEASDSSNVISLEAAKAGGAKAGPGRGRSKVVSLKPKDEAEDLASEKRDALLSALNELEACREMLYSRKDN